MCWFTSSKTIKVEWRFVNITKKDTKQLCTRLFCMRYRLCTMLLKNKFYHKSVLQPFHATKTKRKKYRYDFHTHKFWKLKKYSFKSCILQIYQRFLVFLNFAQKSCKNLILSENYKYIFMTLCLQGSYQLMLLIFLKIAIIWKISSFNYCVKFVLGKKMSLYFFWQWR